MKSKLKYILFISPLIFALDQITKAWIVKNIFFGTKITIWPSFFDLVHTRNQGAAFGFLSNWSDEWREPFFYIVSLIAVIFLFYFLKQLPDKNRIGFIAIALIFGGALGNICDRITRGSVVDFLSFHWYDKSVHWLVFGKHISIDLIWPAFNVADSAISVGVVLLMFQMSKQKK